jgi:hypothetical protein
MKKDIEHSAELEDRLYHQTLPKMYDRAFDESVLLFNDVYLETSGFRDLSVSPFLANSKRLKILRYIVKPSLSQMKFGQLFGIDNIAAYEDFNGVPSNKMQERLVEKWKSIQNFVSSNCDPRRFPWLHRGQSGGETESEIDAARNWTCGLIADANAQTEYRNWRRAQQENSIADWLVRRGYSESRIQNAICTPDDLNIGEYSREKKVQGQTLQKADICIRSKQKGNPLVLIEAKAVGVKIDAYKRCKECCDKARDWNGARLRSPQVVALIAGHFSETNLRALTTAGIICVWEHRLDDLGVLV